MSSVSESVIRSNEVNNAYYLPEEEKAVFEHSVLHVAKVRYDGRYGDQGHVEKFSPYKLEMDLSSNDDKAILRGPYGETVIKIEEAPDDYIIKHVKGSLNFKIKGGKEGLKEWMCNPEQFSIEINRFGFCLTDISDSKKLAPNYEGFSIHQEIKMLKARPDFEYGKDFSYLYSKEPLPMYRNSGVNKDEAWHKVFDYVQNNPMVMPEDDFERKGYYFEIDNDTAVFSERVLRVTRVENHPKYGDQCHNEFFSPHFLKLDLSLKGDKAMLTGPYGEQAVTIKEPSNDALIQRRKGSMTISIKGGKDGLREWMMNPDKHDTELNFLKTAVNRISQEKKLAPVDDYDSRKEIAKLKARPDFEYGKDYSFLYSNEPLPMFEKSKAQGR